MPISMRSFLALALLVPQLTLANVTPFGQEVNQAIEDGLQWLRASQNGNGGWGEPTGLPLLCFLEKRTSEDWNAPAQGYLGMDEPDQENQSDFRQCRQSLAQGIAPYDQERGDEQTVQAIL